MTDILKCDLHDYIETACLFGYEVSLELRDGSVVKGKALTTGIDAEKREYLQLQCAAAQSPQQINTQHIAVLEVLTPNARFQRIHFT